MASVSQLGYLGIAVSDTGAWDKFATEIAGLAVSERLPDGTLRLRMDDYHYRIAVHPHGEDDVAYVGWEVADRETLRAVAKQVEAAGVEVRAGSAEEAKSRAVVELLKFRDPNGVESDLFYGPLMARDAFKSPRAISGFHTGAQGLGHFILVVDDLDKSLDFYMKALGFRVSDFITLGASGPRLGFLHCNPRHHTLALLPIPNSPKRLNHIMLELKSVDDVVSTYDLCQQRQVPIVMSMGRHTNDRMMSFYMATPSGFMIEYGWGGRAVDDRTWQVQYHTAGSVWGHRFVGGNPPFSA